MAFSLGFITDTHVNVSAHTAKVRTCLDWLQAQAPTMSGLLCAGDMSDNPTDATLFSDWIRSSSGGNLAAGIHTIMALGNWDADKSSSPANYDTIVDPPFAFTTALYGSLFSGAEYYSWATGKALVGVVNSNADSLDNSGAAAYFNCNPPGASTLNPDHTGLSIAGSAQRTWLDSVFEADYRWKIVMAHRSFWAPYDYDLRKLNRDGRAALAKPIDDGVSLVFTGDIHVGSLSGPWYPSGGPVADPSAKYVTPGGKGAYSLTLAGGYATRQVDTTVLPDHASTCLWSSGGAANSGIVQVAHIVFGAATAEIRIFEASTANPTGSVVYSGTLVRNTSGESANMVETAVFGILSASAGVNALVGTDPVRVFPIAAPQGAALPLVVYEKASEPRVHAMGSDPGLASASIRCHCWASTALGAKSLAAAVRSAMQDYTGSVGGVTVQRAFLEDESDDYDDETDRFVSLVDFMIWFEE